MIEQVNSEVEAAIESQLSLLQSLANQHPSFAPIAERMALLLSKPLA